MFHQGQGSEAEEELVGGTAAESGWGTRGVSGTGREPRSGRRGDEEPSGCQEEGAPRIWTEEIGLVEVGKELQQTVEESGDLQLPFLGLVCGMFPDVARSDSCPGDETCPVPSERFPDLVENKCPDLVDKESYPD